MNLEIATDRLEQAAPSCFLDMLTAPLDCPHDCSDVLLVVAHPDDETIALGGQLSRLRGIRILHVTDGAPANMKDAHAKGFSQREDYSSARRLELLTAIDQAGVGGDALLSFGIGDQHAAYCIPVLVMRLAALLMELRISTVLTHAYEGGHPDHDATAFVVHAARQLVSPRQHTPPEIVEFPLYCARDGIVALQQFASAPPDRIPAELTVRLDEAARKRKRRMLRQFATQRTTLAPFDLAVERFRRALDYDFGSLPNGGEVLYESYDWGLTGSKWLRLTDKACREFGLPRWL